MAELNKELLEKAKQANSAEELLALAKENNVEFTQEQAEAYFEQMNKSGELSDDELNNVAGGTCYHGGRPVVTAVEYCTCWTCEHCGGTQRDDSYGMGHNCIIKDRCIWVSCASCGYSEYEDGLLLCDNPNRRK